MPIRWGTLRCASYKFHDSQVKEKRHSDNVYSHPHFSGVGEKAVNSPFTGHIKGATGTLI